jgi:prepilin-type N-terminal cleavage/methylation domain-containing protein
MKARGFTLIELLIVVGLVAILFAAAVPWLLNARIAANEASAVSSLESINNAQALYREVCGKGQYAAALPGLGQPMPTTGDVFLSPDLTGSEIVVKSGYQIAMSGLTPEPVAEPESAEPTDVLQGATEPVSPGKGCNDADTAPAYIVTADPVRPGNSGRRYFATNGSRAVYENTETFVEKMPATGAPPVGAELK